MAILEPFALAIGFLLSYVYDFTLSYGFAIAILTVIINVIIFPLTLRQTRSTKRMQDAQSDIKKLQKQHKDNKEELNKAMAAMYKEKGINPLGCILPLIIQMPIWFALFRVLREPLSFIPSTSVLFKDLEVSTSLTFFNMDLQIPPSEVAGWVDRVPYLILILFVILTALYQQQQITKKTQTNTKRKYKRYNNTKQIQRTYSLDEKRGKFILFGKGILRPTDAWLEKGFCSFCWFLFFVISWPFSCIFVYFITYVLHIFGIFGKVFTKL